MYDTHIQIVSLICCFSSTSSTILEVMMYNGLTGAVGAYTRFITHQSSLPMSAALLEVNDTLASLWEWLARFWDQYKRLCQEKFISYLNGSTYTDNDLQPVLVMLSSIVKVCIKRNIQMSVLVTLFVFLSCNPSTILIFSMLLYPNLNHLLGHGETSICTHKRFFQRMFCFR